ncbi:hypothetical protein [Microvirga sp. P5_D2]
MKTKQGFGGAVTASILPSNSLKERWHRCAWGASMNGKKQKLLPRKRRQISRVERQLAAVEAQIARLENDPQLGLAERDHFLLWKRPSLFVTERLEVLH